MIDRYNNIVLSFLQGEEVDQEAEEVLNELNLLTESEADGGQGDEFPTGTLILKNIYL